MRVLLSLLLITLGFAQELQIIIENQLLNLSQNNQVDVQELISWMQENKELIQNLEEAFDFENIDFAKFKADIQAIFDQYNSKSFSSFLERGENTVYVDASKRRNVPKSRRSIFFNYDTDEQSLQTRQSRSRRLGMIAANQLFNLLQIQDHQTITGQSFLSQLDLDELKDIDDAGILINAQNTHMKESQNEVFHVDHSTSGIIFNSFLEIEQPNKAYQNLHTYPKYVLDYGNYKQEGKMFLILATQYEEGVPESGQLLVIPEIDGQVYEATILLQNLNRPQGICFDINHNFLYISDLGYDNHGGVYQLEIEWVHDKLFRVQRDFIAQIYKGVSPTDCVVDAYGNIFITDNDRDQIVEVDYMTLWGAYSNSSYDFRSALNPSKIDVFKKLYYISNNQIIWADSIPTTTNDDHMGILGDNALDLAVDEERQLFFSTADGDIIKQRNGYNHLKSQSYFENPHSICYGNDKLYVADDQIGGIYTLNTDNDSEETPKLFYQLQNVKNIYCLNDTEYIDMSGGAMLTLTFLILVL